MKYVKGTTFTTPMEQLNHGKIRLTMNDGFAETPWIGSAPESPDEVVLLNHALIFSPFESWGMILPKGSSNMEEIRKSEQITLHPEAFDKYIEEGIINAEGTPLIDYAEKIAVYRGSDDEETEEEASPLKVVR